MLYQTNFMKKIYLLLMLLLGTMGVWAHTFELRAKLNPDGSATFYARTYHGTGELVSGGFIVDGVTYPFTGVFNQADLPTGTILISKCVYTFSSSDNYQYVTVPNFNSCIVHSFDCTSGAAETPLCPLSASLNLGGPSITLQPASASGTYSCINATNTITVNATGSNLTYQWQINTGGGFVNLAADNNYANVTTNVLSISNITMAMDGYKFQCVISGTDACNNTSSVTSDVITLSPAVPPAITTQPATTVSGTTGTATFSVVATGTNLTYQWQVSTNAGSNWTNVSGGNASTLTVSGVTTAMQGYLYHVIINGSCPVPITSNNSTLIINLPPTALALSLSTIAENNVTGAVVGNLSTTDPDAGNTFTYTLVSGSGDTDNAGFTIAGAQLKAAVSFNYEVKNSYTVRIRTTDQGGLSFERAVAITVSDVNEVPTLLNLVQVALYENRPSGTLAANLTAAAPESYATFTYSLAAGTGDTDNSSFQVSGTTLLTAQSLNYEQKQSYSVRLRVTTQAGLFLEKAFTIAINDVNEIPTLDAIAEQHIYYSTQERVVSLTNLTAEPETAQTVTTTISSDNDALFSELLISGTQLKYIIKPGQLGVANVTVTVKDNGGIANGGIDVLTRTFKLSVDPTPTITGTSNQTGTAIPESASDHPVISKGLSSKLQVNALSAVSYSWSPATGLSSTTVANPVATPSKTTTYAVTVTNSLGSSITVNITVVVNEDYIVFPSNNFSPNGDGVNDFWTIGNLSSYPNNVVKIFDRGGRLMLNVHNYQQDWYGTLNGSPLAEGTYYYIIDFQMPNVAPKKGFITLVR